MSEAEVDNSDTSGKRVAYLIPGPMDLTELGAGEVQRRADKLKAWAERGTDVTVRTTESGPGTIESAYEEYLSIPPTAKLLREVEEEGFDAAIIGCFGDPGLDGLREISDMLVVGPAAASIALATTLGHRFGIVTVAASIVPALRRLVWEAGALDALAGIRYIEAPVLSITAQPDEALKRMVRVGREAIESDAADTLVLGCMSMGFLDVAEEMTRLLGVPVINPSKASLKIAEAAVALGLTHSRAAYRTPPKLAGGAAIDDLVISR